MLIKSINAYHAHAKNPMFSLFQCYAWLSSLLVVMVGLWEGWWGSGWWGVNGLTWRDTDRHSQPCPYLEGKLYILIILYYTNSNCKIMIYTHHGGYGYRYGHGYRKPYPCLYPWYPYLHTCWVYPYPCRSLKVSKRIVQFIPLRFSSAKLLNLELDFEFSPRGSGLNFGSEPNFSNTSEWQVWGMKEVYTKDLGNLQKCTHQSVVQSPWYKDLIWGVSIPVTQPIWLSVIFLWNSGDMWHHDPCDGSSILSLYCIKIFGTCKNYIYG